MADQRTKEQLRIEELEKELAALKASKLSEPEVAHAKLADEHKDGEYQHKTTGEKFKLKKVCADENNGRTHILKNAVHTYECSEDEMRKDFDKV